MPKNDQIWPEIGILVHIGQGLAGSFGALLVVVARGLYLVPIEDCSRPLILLIVQGMSYNSSLAGRRNRNFLIRVCPIWRSIGAPYLVTFPYLVIFQYSVIPDMIAGIHCSKVSQIKHLFLNNFESGID